MTLFCFESLMTFICRIIGFNLERVMKRPYHINEGSTKFIIGSKLPYEFSRPSVGRSDGWSVVGLYHAFLKGEKLHFHAPIGALFC